MDGPGTSTGLGELTLSGTPGMGLLRVAIFLVGSRYKLLLSPAHASV